jgi:GYF domain 2/Domain of unknown function (DUF4190)
MAGEDVAETWYVRARGRIQGPLSWAQLRALRDRGQLARFDQISRDRQSWAPADSLEHLFPRAGAGGAFVPAAQAKNRGPRRGSEPEEVGFLIIDDDASAAGAIVAPGRAGPAADEPAGWYYAESGAPQGPVGLTELERLASDGRIGPGTLYWRSGLEQWTPGSDLPELNRLWLYEADPGAATGGLMQPLPGRRIEPVPAPEAPQINPLAILSLALNLFCGIGNLAAIGAGAVALRQIARSNATLAGRGIALAGVIVGILGLVTSVLAGFWIFAKGS